MKTYSEFLRESTIVEGASIIRAGSRKKSSYRGPTGDHRRDKEGNIVASHYKKTKTVLLDPPPKKGKKKKGPINWQKTKKNQKKKNKTIKAQHLANKKKKKESSYASQVGKYVPKTP